MVHSQICSIVFLFVVYPDYGTWSSMRVTSGPDVFLAVNIFFFNLSILMTLMSQDTSVKNCIYHLLETHTALNKHTNYGERLST